MVKIETTNFTVWWSAKNETNFEICILIPLIKLLFFF